MLWESSLLVYLSAGYGSHCAFLITVPPGVLPEMGARFGEAFVTTQSCCMSGNAHVNVVVSVLLCEQTSNGKQLWLPKSRKILSLKE